MFSRYYLCENRMLVFAIVPDWPLLRDGLPCAIWRRRGRVCLCENNFGCALAFLIWAEEQLRSLSYQNTLSTGTMKRGLKSEL